MLCPSCGRENPSDAQFGNECEGNLDIPVAKTAIPSKKTAEESSILTSGTFVGRHREIAALQAALADALAGQGRMMMLVGEPGIGKTRTARNWLVMLKPWEFKCCGAAATKSRAHHPTGSGCNPFAPMPCFSGMSLAIGSRPYPYWRSL